MVSVATVKIKKKGDSSYRLLIPFKIRRELKINDTSQNFFVEHERGNLKFIINDNGNFKLQKGYMYFNNAFKEYFDVEFTSVETFEKGFILNKKETCEENTKLPLQLTMSEMVLFEIKRLYENDVDLLPYNIRKNYNRYFNSAGHYFGSWKKAVLAAGIEYPEYINKRQSGIFKRSKEDVLKELKSLHGDGVVLTSSNIFNNYQSLYKAIKNYYKHWKDLLIDLEISHSDELKKSANNLRVCGFLFESIVDDIFNELNMKYTKYDSKKKSLNPDYIFNKLHWCDAKLSNWTALDSRCRTIEKYEKQCKLLTIVYFIGDESKEEMVTKKTRLISVYKLIKQLPKSKRKIFNSQLNELHTLVSNTNEQQRFSKVNQEILHKEIKHVLDNINLENYEIIKIRNSKKINVETVIKIKELLFNGFKMSDVSRYFEIDKSTIKAIKDKKIWQGVIRKIA